MLNNIYSIFYMQKIFFFFYLTCEFLFLELICNISLHYTSLSICLPIYRLNWLSQFQGIDMSFHVYDYRAITDIEFQNSDSNIN